MSLIFSGSAFQWPVDAPPTLARLLHSRIEKSPGSRFIEISHGGERSSRTSAELYRSALELLPELRKQTPGAAADFVLCFESALDFIPAAWACICGGYSWNPWQVSKLSSDREMRARLEVLDRKLNDPVLLCSDRLKTRIASLDAWPRCILSLDEDLRPRGRRWTARAEPDLGGADGADVLMLTSGTTGTPKIAILSERAVLSRFFSRPESLPGRIRINCFPFDSVTGLWIIFPGAADTIYLQPDRLAAQPLDFFAIVEEFDAKGVVLSTSLAARIQDAAESVSGKFDLSSLENVGFGSEMIVPNVILKFGKMLEGMGATKLQFAFGYGMTETGPLCLSERMTLPELARHLGPPADPVNVGKPSAGWSLRVVGDAGSALASGTAGNIEVWSDSKLFSGYRNDPEITRASFTADGWFKTGDAGIASPDGVTITGRQKATIIVNGRNIGLESIETPVRQMDGIRGALVAAAPVRLRDSVTDELAVFFVPRSKEIVDDLSGRIVREIARHSGVSVKHLVPVEAADFPMTASGKARRNELVQLYPAGRLMSHSPTRPTPAEVPFTPSQAWLVQIWQKILKLQTLPSLHDNFFELGGDSLASAELIFAVEGRFHCDLPLEPFFEQPTIATIDALLTRQKTASSSVPVFQAFQGDRLLHKLQSFVGSWRGRRLFSDSLLVGFNSDGRRLPIFFVYQDYREAAQLAKHLGPDQPLYAMRSCAGILALRDYTAEVLEAVCSRYLWEMLALQTGTSFILGGDCQGGILALTMARRLTQIGRPPLLLALQEWTYSYGRYVGPTLLIYGEESHAAEIYRHPETSKINWNEDFPCCVVTSVPGKHGELSWRDESVAVLAKILRREGDDRGTSNQSIAHGANGHELAVKLALSEAQVGELRATLLARESVRVNAEEGEKSEDYKLIDAPLGVDRNWYLSNYPDVAKAEVDPVAHYLEHGWREGRDPRPDFSTLGYLRANDDVARAGCNPLVHYIRWGRTEGRSLGRGPALWLGSSPDAPR